MARLTRVKVQKVRGEIQISSYKRAGRGGHARVGQVTCKAEDLEETLNKPETIIKLGLPTKAKPIT